MRALQVVISALVALAPLGSQETVRFRQFIAGQELGGNETTTTSGPWGVRVESREWVKLSRLGMDISQEARQTATRSVGGAITFTWRVNLSAEPFEGEATWAPARPAVLSLKVKGAAPKEVSVPPGALLWPGDVDDRLQAAARARQDVTVVSYNFPFQQWSEQTLRFDRADPLPGYLDAVRFTGSEVQGPARMEVTSWISPSQGEVRHAASFSGLPLLTQRADLPAPAPTGTQGFFASTLKPLPSHPFQPWLRELDLRWQGKTPPVLPQDDQQTPEGPRMHLKRAAPPTPEEAAQPPVKGTPSAEEVPFLAATSLAQFKDPAFDGLVARLNPPKGASRWTLARLVTGFVYDWIEVKDFGVGFASALEVARTPRGDCTEHGVLAVALLRKLGVPARGVVGWVALEQTLGLHFWVEVKLGNRWVPVDPTFDQAPASAFRLKLNTTDLANLGSIGWDSAGQAFGDGAWVPETPYAEALRVTGDTAFVPQGPTLRLPGATWTFSAGRLRLQGRWPLEATLRPPSSLTAQAQALQARGRRGWWVASARQVYAEVAPGRWIRVEGLTEAEAGSVLEGLSLTE